jgi:hypothetical protein
MVAVVILAIIKRFLLRWFEADEKSAKISNS